MLYMGDVLLDGDFLNFAPLPVYTAVVDASFQNGNLVESPRQLRTIEAGVQSGTGERSRSISVTDRKDEGRRVNEVINIYLKSNLDGINQQMRVDRLAPQLLRQGDIVYYRGIVWEVDAFSDWDEAGYYYNVATKTNRKWPTQGYDIYWIGTEDNPDFNDPANWFNGITPSVGDNFSVAPNASITINYGAAFFVDQEVSLTPTEGNTFSFEFPASLNLVNSELISAAVSKTTDELIGDSNSSITLNDGASLEINGNCTFEGLISISADSEFIVNGDIQNSNLELFNNTVINGNINNGVYFKINNSASVTAEFGGNYPDLATVKEGIESGMFDGLGLIAVDNGDGTFKVKVNL